MKNTEPTNPMKTVYDVTTNVILKFIQYLSNEINSNGGYFTLRQQINYSKFYNEILKINLFEKVKSSSNDETESKVGIIQIFLKSQEYIELYEKNKKLFYSYDRKQIAFEKFMELNKFYSSQIDRNDLLIMFNKERYFECEEYYTQTDFYRNVGVLLKNYHELFYVYCKHLQIRIRTKEYSDETNNAFIIKTYNFFDFSLLSLTHKKISNIIFEEISEEDFISFFNLKNDFITLEIKKNQNNKVYGLIGKLLELVENDFKEIWLDNILKNLKLQKTIYKSKLKEYLKAEKGFNLGYKELIEIFFKKYKELNEL